MYNGSMEIIKEYWPGLLDILIKTGFDLVIILTIVIVARFALNLFSRITGKTFKRADKFKDKDKSQKVKTSMTITHSANRYIVYFVVIILCLRVIGLGEEISGMLVAAEVGGLVLSLGAQSMVKDILAGMFLMFERQFYVGDYIRIGEFEGTVTSIALRVTYLECSGKRVIIPNGEIRNVINYTRTNSMAVITIPTPYEADTRKLITILQKVVDKYYETHSDLLTENKAVVPGIDTLSKESVDITIRVETKPLKHWQVQRDLLLLIKEELNKRKIAIPYNQSYKTK